MYYIRLRDEQQRKNFINCMSEKKIVTSFHYNPLHSSLAGKRFGDFCGVDEHTTLESSRLVRLPLYYKMGFKDLKYIIESTTSVLEKI